MSIKNIQITVQENDIKNLNFIQTAFDENRINLETKNYMDMLYSNSSENFLKLFHILGACFGAPKAAVQPYDYESSSTTDEFIKISDINHLSPYMAYHRLDTDPVRNQFFSFNSNGTNVSLFVSPIVSVIVGAQKNIERAIDKITGKYYNDYIRDVLIATKKCMEDNNQSEKWDFIEPKIKKIFSENYITNAAETLIDLMADDCKTLAANLVRCLDKVEKPYSRLKDVWRVKCLFDLVPQIRNFIENVKEKWPYKILAYKDTFSSTNHPRDYRDAKVVLNISDDNSKITPMEIICQVRTLFKADNESHSIYKKIRDQSDKNLDPSKDINTEIATVANRGVKEYNMVVYKCLEELFERAGWNILYSYDTGSSLLDGFPRITKQYVSNKMTEAILDKLNKQIENGLIALENLPRDLSRAEEIKIFEWMAKFIFVSAMPYQCTDWEIPKNTVAGKLFSYIMKEMQRYSNN